MAQIKDFLIVWKWYVVGAVAALLVIGGLLFSFFGGSDAAPASETLRKVNVARVSELMGGGNSLSVVAKITSVSEAKISPEIGGRIVRVNASLGARVGAGQILAEIENASQRAAVLQAEGVLDAAKAAAGGSEGSAVATLLTAYGAVNSAIEDAVGQIYTDPEYSDGVFSVSTRATQMLADIEEKRERMLDIAARQSEQATTITDATAVSELPAVEKELREVRAYLDQVLVVLNAGVPHDDITSAVIAGYVADVTAARAAVTVSLSAISSARTSLDSNGTVSASAASVKQAQGAYNAAVAALEKTIIRSPIAGTLNNFTIKLGDTVAAQQQVAIVSNNNALEAVAYVTESDRSRIAVGQKVAVDDFNGTITKIAPALDPVTRRIEVRIGLPSNATSLTNGETVRIELAESSTPVQVVSGPIAIPITALKMEASRTAIYQVQDGKLVSKTITIGKLSGDSVQVTDGLSIDDEIVVDVRGLKEGQEVTVE